MIIKDQAQFIVETRIEEILDIAKSLYPEMYDFEYRFKECKGVAAGKAGFKVTNGKRSYYIKLNIDMMVRGMEEWNHIFFDTIPHEVAHLVDYVRRGKSGHDKIWRDIAISLGCKGDRCHNLDVVARGRHRYYIDGFGKVNVSQYSHEKIQSKDYDGTVTCGGGRYVLEKKHYVDMNRMMDEIPEDFKQYIHGIEIVETRKSVCVSPTGIKMTKPTKKAMKLWESGYNNWVDFNNNYGVGQYTTVSNQYKLCVKWYGA